jgi:hypothetical protein
MKGQVKDRTIYNEIVLVSLGKIQKTGNRGLIFPISK